MIKNRNIVEQRKNIIFILIPLFIVWLILCSVCYYISSKNNVINDIKTTLINNTEKNIDSVNYTLQQYINTSQTTANKMEITTELDREMIEYFQSIVNNNNFNELELIRKNRLGLAFNGDEIIVTYKTFEEELELFHPGVSDEYTDADGNRYISFVSHVFDNNNEITGIIKCEIALESLSEYFQETCFVLGGYFHVIDSNGSYIAASDSNSVLILNTNFYDDVKLIDFYNGYTHNNFSKDVSNGKSIYMEYSYEGNYRYAYVSPMGINNWLFYNVTTNEHIESVTRKHLNTTMILLVNIICMFLVLLYAVVYMQTLRRKESLLYNKYFSTISDHLQQSIIEYNYETNSFNFLSEKDLDIKNISQLFNNLNQEFSLVFGEDIKIFTSFIDDVKAYNNPESINIRIKTKHDEFLWHKISNFKVNTEINEPCNTIIMIENIDLQVKNELQLKEKSEIDQLSQLYNKNTSNNLIESLLINSNAINDKHALFIVDIDNFKQVNDTLGHNIGDEAIKELSKQLKDIFRHNDIVGRIGGDEFIAVLTNYMDEEIIIKKAEKICSEFNKTFENNKLKVQVSSSVGIALYPNDGTTFKELFNNADKALYQVKNSGKNNYFIYSPHINSNNSK